MKAVFNERRMAMIAGLKRIGFDIKVDPTAAFYVLADARKFSADSYHFAFEILDEAGVGVAPGIDFGDNAEGFIRFSYTNSLRNIHAGLDRIDRYLRERFGPHARRNSEIGREASQNIRVSREGLPGPDRLFDQGFPLPGKRSSAGSGRLCGRL